MKWTLAESVCTASGRPEASAITMSFVPLARLVFPTFAPPFGHHECAVTEAFREVYGSAFFKVSGQSLKDFAECPRFHPLAESAVTD